MRINNGIYALDIVEYKGERFLVEKVEKGKCILKGDSGKLLKDIDVSECKKVILE